MTYQHAFTLDSPTGTKISAHHEPAHSAARAIFLLSHGLAEHSLRYAQFAGFLAARGYHVYGFDHRGHGLTTAPDAEPGRFAKRDGEAKVLADLKTVREHAEARHPGLPIILFGHSMGGVIAARAAEVEPQAYRGLCVWNSQLNPGLAGQAGLALLKAERFFKGSDVPSFFGQRLVLDPWAKSIAGARTEFDWLSRDEREVDKYIADPLCGFACSVSLWIDLLDMSIGAGQDRNLARLPKTLAINLVGGGEDPATENGRAMEWLAARLKRSGITNVHLTIYPGMRHETLNEHGRDDAMKALADWADGVAAT
ncbi:alpha/beta hydrolase [Rhizobium sp. TH2]|uniref:alpha/beta hydrolase n=1 Tax=Rhizobium sp. TH2 TaxID=2775403 RepID=UPI00215788C7|nr:alpha/beta hydrolase [Rhizobium sp. TH2]UVC06901.1 alpha/beta hydrolase [Rhizobium sp. TH2]